MESSTITDPAGQRWEVTEARGRLGSDPGWALFKLRFRNLLTEELREIGSLARLDEMGDAELQKVLRRAKRWTGAAKQARGTGEDEERVTT